MAIHNELSIIETPTAQIISQVDDAGIAFELEKNLRSRHPKFRMIDIGKIATSHVKKNGNQKLCKRLGVRSQTKKIC
jgi:hypothetical protein